MKKIFVSVLLSFLALGAYTTVDARTQYDSTGHVIYDDTIRGRKQAAIEKVQQSEEQVSQAAAAAKIDYEAAYKALNDSRPKSTYYQSSEAYKAYKKKQNIK